MRTQLNYAGQVEHYFTEPVKLGVFHGTEWMFDYTEMTARE